MADGSQRSWRRPDSVRLDSRRVIRRFPGRYGARVAGGEVAQRTFTAITSRARGGIGDRETIFRTGAAAAAAKTDSGSCGFPGCGEAGGGRGYKRGGRRSGREIEQQIAQ